MINIRSIMRRMLILILCIAALAGCVTQGGTLEKPAQMAYMVDPTGCVIGAGTVGTSLDASFTFSGRYCRHPETGGWAIVNGDGTFGPTLTGRLLEAFVAGPLTAVGQGIGGRIARCSNCGSDTTWNIQSQAEAAAITDGTVNNETTVKNRTGW